MNIANHLERAGRVFGDRPAVALGSNVLLTYREVADRVSRLSLSLHQHFGCQPGDRVALCLKNCPEYLELLYACWHAGLIAVPINAKLHANEFAYILADSGARLAFTTPELSATIAGLKGTALAHTIEVGTAEYRGLVTGDAATLTHRAPHDYAWLFYTSGTTGRPKGATLTHRNFHAMMAGYFMDVDPGGPWSSILHAAPMSHGSGLYGLAHVAQASCHIISESAGFDVAEVYALIRRWPGLAFFAAPTMLKRLLDAPDDEDTTHLKLIIYGGGPMYVEDCRQALQRFGPKLSQLYGQGESPMTITALNAALHGDARHPRWLERLASVGLPQSPVEMRIADSDDQPLPTGEVGEILVRGDTVMAGYWQNDEATQAALKGGWLHTGDMGFLDEEGFLTLRDRSKDMIISGGTNIYPREIEEVLLQHPDISEAAVIGRPDREWGESVVAFIVPTNPNITPTMTDLEIHCTAQMARFKRPKAYHFVNTLPKNNYGKILKTALRELDKTRGT